MAKKKPKPKAKTPARKKPAKASPPDGRGPRPADPNELAKWIVDRTTNDDPK